MALLLPRIFLLAFAASSLCAGCASSRADTREAEPWITDVTPATSEQLRALCPLRQSQPLEFTPASPRAEAISLLAATSFVSLSAVQLLALGGAALGPPAGVPLLLRAVRMVPPDGVLTVTACGSVLYVNYTGAPSHAHTGLERFPVLTLVPTLPTHVVVVAGEGIP